MFVILLLILLLTLIIFLFLWYKRRGKSFHKLPPAFPGGIPIIGHTHLLRGNTSYLWDLLVKLAEESIKNEGLIYASIVGSNYYVLTDPEDSLTAMNACLHKHFFFGLAEPWLGEGLLTAPVAVWKNHLKLLKPAIGQLTTDKCMCVFNAQSRKLVNRMEVQIGKGHFGHLHYLGINALEILNAIALIGGDKDPGIDTEAYIKAINNILSVTITRCQKFWLYNDFIYSLSPTKVRRENTVQVIRNEYEKVIKMKKSNDSKNDFKDKTFMDLLLELADKGALTDKQVWDHINTLTVAAYDTTATALTFALMAVGTYPHVQKKIVDELKDVFADFDRDVDKEDLSRLTYLDAVIKETLRLYPPVPLTLREVTKDVKLKNYTIPAGSNCLLHMYGIHRHSSWGADANQFIPDRWLQQHTLPKHPNAFSPFGLGRRPCIGKSYAMMSMKTTLAHILRRYHISADITKLKLKIHMIIRPSSGDNISIERRYL